MDQKQSDRMMLRAVAVLVALTVILVVGAFKWTDAIWGRIVLLCCAAFPLLVALLCIYLMILAHSKREYNYFLYDKKRKGNMPQEELTVDHVSDCLVRYMMLFRQGKELYLSSLFDENGGAPEVFKPLFCYQTLGMMSVCEEDFRWKNFVSGGKEMADAFSSYLSAAGDEELGRRIQYYIATSDHGSMAEFRDYLREKSDYLAERMLAYTREHIREFDC